MSEPTPPNYAEKLVDKQRAEMLAGLKSLVTQLESDQPVPGLFFYGVKKVKPLDKPGTFALDDSVGILVTEGPHADLVARQLYAQCVDLMQKLQVSVFRADQQKKKGPLDVQ